MGLGCVAAGLGAVTERRELLSLLHDCLDRDDANSLQQLFAVKGVEGSFPGLLGRAVEKTASKCYAVLTQNPPLICPRDLEDTVVQKGREIETEMLRRLLADKILDPNVWVKVSERVSEEYVYPWNVVWKPILSVFIDQKNFGCANVLMDFGARVDVCEWEAETPDMEPDGSDDEDGYEFAVWNNNNSFPGKNPLLSMILALSPTCFPTSPPVLSEEALSLLKRLVAAKECGSLDWTATVPEAAIPFLYQAQSRQYELSAVSLAVASLQPAVLGVVLESNPKVMGGLSKESPLSMATLNTRIGKPWSEGGDRCAGIFELLAKAGINLDPPGILSASQRETHPLYHACRNGFVKVLEVLKQTGVDVRDDSRGFLPLLLCVENRQWDAAMTILETEGVDPNRKGKVWGGG
eukprot:Cvel_28240.t1-p1 / transcript=Cvel_28240.t1 / gene=Cvel_28240 / organism=Chromera_velia_CCMP2878 / gene_product=hypothetical protein / transcript_product=hypothetical protein / location=Cvel_scaffold3657:13445-14667(+) / protein_length=407 / sequence_SO=supercontig / SO=protein_coding / is_pseudo=false